MSLFGEYETSSNSINSFNGINENPEVQLKIIQDLQLNHFKSDTKVQPWQLYFFIITESLVPAEMQNQSEVMYAVNLVNQVMLIDNRLLNQLPSLQP